MMTDDTPLPPGIVSVGAVILASSARPYYIMGGKNSDTPRFAASKLGAELLREAPAAKDAGARLYAYHDDAWQPDGEEFYRRAVRERMGDVWLPKHAAEVLTWIGDGAPLLDPAPPHDCIRVLNGILRINREGKVTLEPPSVDPLTPVRLPVRYDPDAQCPVFEKFMEEVLPPGPRKTAQEVMGYLLTADNSHQKAVLARGEGGNGKTTWVQTVSALLGNDNVSAHPLHALGDSRFAAADLYGKLANICADISSQELSSSALFRSITGGDEIQGEHKYKNSFKFKPFARLVFSANKFPPITNPSNALFDRWLVIPFDRRFRGAAGEDKELVSKMTTPEELSGVLNYALAGLRRLRRQGAFTTSPSSQRALEEFRMAADTVALFVREDLESGRFYRRSTTWDMFGAPSDSVVKSSW
jgi:putative DNA primase/helicase